MPESEDAFEVCQSCGATIYPEQLARSVAGRWQGRLLCGHCLADARAGGAAQPAAVAAGGIDLADGEPAAAPTAGHAPAAGHAGGGPMVSAYAPRANPAAGIQRERSIYQYTSFKRPLEPGSAYATRCRTFHCKLSDASFAHLNDLINEWIDTQPEVRVKFATSSIGVVEGKHADPHLIVTLFY